MTGRLAAAGVALATALVFVPSALAAQLLIDRNFEKPKTKVLEVFPSGSSLLTCSGGAHDCWLVTAGQLDLVPTSVWVPAAGKQSIELNGGSRSAEVAQAR